MRGQQGDQPRPGLARKSIDWLDLAALGAQIEPARALLGALGSQIEAARTSQGARGSQIEATRTSQHAQLKPSTHEPR